MLIAYSLGCWGNVAFANGNLDANANYLQKYIKVVENQSQIPRGLLAAIAKVESGANPYALNISGKSFTAGNKEEAIYLLTQAIDRGITNIDIGLMQVNWRWHGENFNSLEEMLNPEANIQYAASFLNNLYKKHGSWHKAIRHYHSANYSHHRVYSRKIIIAWLRG